MATDWDRIRLALGQAIDRAEERAIQVDTTGTLDSSSKAAVAIRKLRKDRRLSREELDRAVTY